MVKFVNKRIGDGCHKHLMWNSFCGQFDIKHSEWYFCDECYKKYMEEEDVMENN